MKLMEMVTELDDAASASTRSSCWRRPISGHLQARASEKGPELYYTCYTIPFLGRESPKQVQEKPRQGMKFIKEHCLKLGWVLTVPPLVDKVQAGM